MKIIEIKEETTIVQNGFSVILEEGDKVEILREASLDALFDKSKAKLIKKVEDLYKTFPDEEDRHTSFYKTIQDIVLIGLNSRDINRVLFDDKNFQVIYEAFYGRFLIKFSISSNDPDCFYVSFTQTDTERVFGVGEVVPKLIATLGQINSLLRNYSS